MKLNPVPHDVAQVGLRVLKTVCLGSRSSKLSSPQAEFLSGVQKYILGTNFDVEVLSQITPQELETLPMDEEFKNRIIRAAVVAACIDGEVDSIEASSIESFAQAFRVDMAPVRTAWNLAKNNLILARFDIARKSLPGFKIRQTFKAGGVRAVIRQFLPLIGIQNLQLSRRYRDLAKLPEGTLGRAYVNYIEKNKFPYPGEKGAGPEIIVTHDCLHILGDYGTSAPEEIEVASFQAGCHSGDPVFGVLFGLAQYHLGVQVAPVAPAQKFQANPDRMIAAFARGCQVKRDMWSDFQPWEHFSKPLEVLRRDFGIPPKA